MTTRGRLLALGAAMATALGLSASATAHQLVCEKSMSGSDIVQPNSDVPYYRIDTTTGPVTFTYQLVVRNALDNGISDVWGLADPILESVAEELNESFSFTQEPPFTLDPSESSVTTFAVTLENPVADCQNLDPLDGKLDNRLVNVFTVAWDQGAESCKVIIECPQETPPTTYRKAGTVFQDLNGNRVQDTGEPGIANVTVRLTNGVDRTTLTDANGDYVFSNLLPGSYTVTIPAQTGDPTDENENLYSFFVNTTPNNDTNTPPPSIDFTIVDSDELGNDFGWKEVGGTYVKAGTVFVDTNGNGMLDPGESGIPNVTLELATGTPLTVTQTTSTDADGRYVFSGLTNGTYTVIIPSTTSDPTDFNEQLYAGYTNTTPNDNTNTPPPSIQFTIDGASELGNNFGWKPSGQYAKSGTVFIDVNENGVQDMNEAGIPNVTVRLTDGITLTSTTNQNGEYSFTGLFPGSYTVDIPENTGNPDDVNEALYQYLVNTTETFIDFTIVDSDETGNDFGWWIEDFPPELCEGDGLSAGFWQSNFGKATGNIPGNAQYTPEELQGFLDYINANLPDEPFPLDSLEDAYAILSPQTPVTLQEQLRRQLLAAELNYAAGLGLDDSSLHLLMISIGKSVAADPMADPGLVEDVKDALEAINTQAGPVCQSNGG